MIIMCNIISESELLREDLLLRVEVGTRGVPEVKMAYQILKTRFNLVDKIERILSHIENQKQPVYGRDDSYDDLLRQISLFTLSYLSSKPYSLEYDNKLSKDHYRFFVMTALRVLLLLPTDTNSVLLSLKNACHMNEFVNFIIQNHHKRSQILSKLSSMMLSLD